MTAVPPLNACPFCGPLEDCPHDGVELYLCQPMRFMWCRDCGSLHVETVGGKPGEWRQPDGGKSA